MGWLRTSLSAGVAIVVSSGLAMAQTTGTISGRVIDAQGLSVPGVAVNATSPNLQGAQSVVTSGNGDYILPQLPAGTYEMVCWLPSWHVARKEIDPETAIIARWAWQAPREQTAKVSVQAGQTSEFTYRWTARMFE